MPRGHVPWARVFACKGAVILGGSAVEAVLAS